MPAGANEPGRAYVGGQAAQRLPHRKGRSSLIAHFRIRAPRGACPSPERTGRECAYVGGQVAQRLPCRKGRSSLIAHFRASTARAHARRSERAGARLCRRTGRAKTVSPKAAIPLWRMPTLQGERCATVCLHANAARFLRSGPRVFHGDRYSLSAPSSARRRRMVLSDCESSPSTAESTLYAS